MVDMVLWGLLLFLVRSVGGCMSMSNIKTMNNSIRKRSRETLPF